MNWAWARRRARGVDLGSIQLASGERMITSAGDPSGFAIALTGQALYLADQHGQRRVDWCDVESAAWDDPVLELREVGVAESTRIVLHDPARVPEAVRERVTSAIVVTERVQLRSSQDGGVGARITGRRRATRDDRGSGLAWSVVFDAGVDPADPELRRSAEHEVARLRALYHP